MMSELNTRDKCDNYFQETINPYLKTPTIITAKRKFSNGIDFSCAFLYEHIRLLCELSHPSVQYNLPSGITCYYFVNNRVLFHEFYDFYKKKPFTPIYPSSGYSFLLTRKHIVVQYITNIGAIIQHFTVGGVIDSLFDTDDLYAQMKLKVVNEFGGQNQAGRIGLLHLI